MSTSHDGLGTANGQGEGQGARRELFNTVLRHGSEERMSTPISGADSPAPRTHSPDLPDHVITVNTGLVSPERSAESMAELPENAWTRAPIDEWSHQTTIEFLEHYKIQAEGMKTALSLNWTGRMLREIVQNDECNEIVTEDLGIKDRMHRITLIAAVKAGMEFKPKTSESKTTGASSTKPTLLAGEKALQIPTVPKGAPGQALPNQASWKIFMTATQGWGDLASKEYSYLINKLKQNQTLSPRYSKVQSSKRAMLS